MTEPFDVIVAGGGMVGATLGLALSRQGKRVACVDPVPLPSSVDRLTRFDQRATACAQTSINAFRQLGLWPDMQFYAAAIEKITVSKQGSWGKSRIAAADIGQQAFGYVIPNDAIAVALNNAWESATDELGGAGPGNALYSYWGQTVVAATVSDSKVGVSLSNGDSIAAKLLVVADGARSALRGSLGIASQTLETQQMALVCNVACEQPKVGEAFERFTDVGPLALLPLPNVSMKDSAHYNLVWCGTAEQVAERQALTENDFAEALIKAFGGSLGRFTSIGQRQAFPLNITVADRLTDHRVVVLGNAAQALHPVAGQGFNLGLRDAASLCDVLLGAEDCGNAMVTNAYAEHRQHDRAEILGLTSTLATGTTFQTSGLASAAFGFGLAAFNQWPSAKQLLSSRASGFQLGLPSLCKMEAGY